MCGRFSITDPDEALRALFGYNGPPIEMEPRYNVAPTQVVPVVRLNRSGGRGIAKLRWGLLPPWAKAAGDGAKMINARADTVADKPAFRDAFKARRCLVPADGFYEFTDPEPGQKLKTKWLFTLKDAELFCIAGVMKQDAFAMLTVEPGPDIAPYHDRQIVVLEPRQWEGWLAAGAPESEFIRPAPAGLTGP